jgi:hypothetical protein
MEYVLAALSVWWLLFLARLVIILDTDIPWYLAHTALGFGAVLLIDPSRWYWGLAVAGGSILFKRLEDLLLVAGDSIRVRMFSAQGNRRRF